MFFIYVGASGQLQILVCIEIPFSSQIGVSIEEVMLKDLKEISDGEIKVAISTVYMTLEVRGNGSNVVAEYPYCIWRLFFNKNDLCYGCQ